MHAGGGASKPLRYIPLALDVIWSVYYSLRILSGIDKLEYHTAGMSFNASEELLFATVAIYIIVIAILLSKEKAYCELLVIFLACIPQVMAGMSDTVYTSMPRTVIYLHAAFLIAGTSLYTKINNVAEITKNMFKIFIGIGFLMNIVLLIHHVIVY